MLLTPATRLGPYEIIAPLGAGGMGVVYRAKDLRLGREVAFKVLPAAMAGDSDRQRRFELEARATARLNHPNILQVFDVGQHEGLPYLVTELLEGETLRRRLESGALSVRKAIELAIAITSGLGAAHEQGITHRDLKPENLFITGDGRVKILDFGLAKLARYGEGDPAPASARTIEAETVSGAVMGTVGYMSPEQVRGQKVDHRSDIFSFGAILYEMLTGRRAFHRDTAADTLSAILSEEPDWKIADEKIPPVLQHVMRHCLEKSPGERFHSARDLAFQLETISGSSSDALAAVAVAAPAPAPAVRFRQITQRRGVIYSAYFAPDGQTILYSASWEGGPSQVYMWRSESPEAIALPLPEAHLLAVSRNGEMALNLAPRWAHNGTWTGTLATAPMFGAAPRQIENEVMGADFDPKQSMLATVRDTPGRGTLESPPGNVLCETSGYFSHLRWSPSGEMIAFLEHPIARDDRGWVAIVDRHGNKRTLTDTYTTIQGLAWSPAGDEIWFTAGVPADTGHTFRRCLHAVNLSGEQRFISGFPGTARLLDIAPDGRLLLARDDDRIAMMGKAPGDGNERDLSWLDWSFPSDFSADGKWLVFEEDRITADYVVGLRPSNGDPTIKLGEGSAKAISRDGRWVLAQRPDPRAPLELLPAGAGRARSIPVGEIDVGEARWLPDGGHIFCTGRAADGKTRAYILDIASGRFDALGLECPDRAFGVAVTADGRRAAISFVDGRSALVPLDGGAVTDGPVLQAGEVIVGFSSDADWLFVEKWGAQSVAVDRVHIDGEKREPWKVLTPNDASGNVLVFRARLALDGDAYAYACYRILSDLYVAEGLS